MEDDTIENEESFLNEYSSLPKILAVSDCLKLYGSFFFDSSSEDLLLHQQDISLEDPITLKRLRTPCRSINCSHLQCFDYDCYIELNKKGRSVSQYICPICKGCANPSKLYVDAVWVFLLDLFPVIYNRSGGMNKLRIDSNGNVTELNGRGGIASNQCTDLIVIEDSDNENELDRNRSTAVIPNISRSPEFAENNRRIVSLYQLSHLKSDHDIFINSSFISLIDIFECTVHDVLYFINNCKNVDLYNIPSIGEYHAERIVKARPFICSSLTVLRHDLMIKLDRLKKDQARSMIENLERIVKCRIDTVKSRIMEYSDRFQFEHLSSSPVRKHKKLRNRSVTSESDYIVSSLMSSPQKTNKKEESIRVQVNVERQVRQVTSSSEDSSFLSFNSPFNVVSSSPSDLERRNSAKGCSFLGHQDSVFLSSATSTPHSKKMKFSDDPKISSLPSALLENQQSFSIHLQLDIIGKTFTPEQLMQRGLPKKTYFNVDEELCREQNSVVSFSTASGTASSVTVSQETMSPKEKKRKKYEKEREQEGFNCHSEYKATGAFHTAGRTEVVLQDAYMPAVIHDATFPMPSLEEFSDPRHVTVPPVLSIVDEDDLFGFGFISTVTRNFDEIDCSLSFDERQETSTGPQYLETVKKSEVDENDIYLNMSSTGRTAHDFNNDVITDRSSPNFNPNLSSPKIPKAQQPQKKLLQLHPIFTNANHSSQCTSAGDYSSLVVSGIPKGKPLPDRKCAVMNQSNEKLNVQQSVPSSKSIIELMVSEFADG
jgi:hypothetical protein